MTYSHSLALNGRSLVPISHPTNDLVGVNTVFKETQEINTRLSKAFEKYITYVPTSVTLFICILARTVV